MDAPTPESYWVEPGALLAGKYPGALDGRATGVESPLLAAGVTLFVDLTEEFELDAVRASARRGRAPRADADPGHGRDDGRADAAHARPDRP